MGRRAHKNPTPVAPFTVVGLAYPENRAITLKERLGSGFFTSAPGVFDSTATLDPHPCPLCGPASLRWERAYHPTDSYTDASGKTRKHAMVFARCSIHGRSDSWSKTPAQAVVTPLVITSQPTFTISTAAPKKDPMPGSLDALVDERISTVVGERLAALEQKTDVDEIKKLIEQSVRTVVITVPTMPEVKFEGTAHPLLSRVLKYIAAGEWLFYIWGPMGSGKSTLAFQLAEALKRPLVAQGMTASTPKEEITGYHNPVTDKYQPATLIEGFEAGAVCLIDECDRGNANTLVALNAVEQGKIYVPRSENPCATRHANTILICTANTAGNGANHNYAGAEALDQSFTGRFRMLYAGTDRAVEIAACGGDEIAIRVVDAIELGRKRADESKVRRVVCLRMARRAAVDFRLDETVTARQHLKAQCKDAGWTETELNAVWA